MKLKNKKTGQIKDWDFVSYFNTVCGKAYGQWECDLAEFIENAEKFRDDWEYYEETKEFWFVNDVGEVKAIEEDDSEETENAKQIGNYFETKEEAEKAVEKLKAWKRLKDKGFKIDGWTIDDGLRISICTNFDGDGIYDEHRKEVKKDLDTCFGGEE